MPSRETDNTTIKSNSKKAMNLQNVQIVTDSTFLLCRSREKNLEEKERGAFISSVRISLPAKDETIFIS